MLDARLPALIRFRPRSIRRSASISALMLLLTACGLAQVPDSVKMTPHRDLGLQPRTVRVPDKFTGKFDATHVVWLPEGYTAQLYWIGGLAAPRFITWGPDSVLYVASSQNGRVFALPDKDHDGVADTAILAAENAFGHDVKFFNGAMYVATQRQVLKFQDLNGDGYYETRTVFIDNIAGTSTNPNGGHVTRTIVFDSTNGKLYLSVGSSCNVCRETGRGIIEQYDIDGTNRRVYATGVRNAVGMTLHPRTGRLWADNNGSDLQGNDIPPEWVDLVRENGFYGWPIAYADGDYFDYRIQDYGALLPLTAADSAMVRSMVQPAVLFQAHTAPMAIEFTNASFPDQFRRGAFVARHGSWNRDPAAGADVVYIDFDNDADTIANYVGEFLTGFTLDSVHTTNRWARPVGLETDNRGRLYVTSDEGNQVFVVMPAGQSSVRRELSDASTELRGASPNPFRGSTSIEFGLAERAQVRLSIVDAMGRRVRTLVDRVMEPGSHTAVLDAEGLAEGVYFCRLDTPAGSKVRSMVLMK